MKNASLARTVVLDVVHGVPLAPNDIGSGLFAYTCMYTIFSIENYNLESTADVLVAHTVLYKMRRFASLCTRRLEEDAVLILDPSTASGEYDLLQAAPMSDSDSATVI